MTVVVVWANLGAGQWSVHGSEESALVWHLPASDLLLELRCHKSPPNTVALVALLKGYVEREQIPLLRVQVAAWSDEGRKRGVGAAALRMMDDILKEGS
jgi:hypothetical protein